jgi:hypothetical protein
MSRNSKQLILELFHADFVGSGLSGSGLCSFHTFGKISLHFVFGSLRGRHNHGIKLHCIGSISLASSFFGLHAIINCSFPQKNVLSNDHENDTSEEIWLTFMIMR